jgi:hypothetical protein
MPVICDFVQLASWNGAGKAAFPFSGTGNPDARYRRYRRAKNAKALAAPSNNSEYVSVNAPGTSSFWPVGPVR